MTLKHENISNLMSNKMITKQKTQIYFLIYQTGKNKICDNSL